MNKVSRNDPCPCGSLKKYKKCCEPRDLERQKKKHEGIRGLRINPLSQQNTPVKAFAKHVFKVITEPLESKQKKEASSAREDEKLSSLENQPQSYSTLEELIGIEGEPQEKLE